MDDRTLERLADLLVGYGANVQPGQMVSIGTDLGKEPLTRAIARSCYRAGAVFVDVDYNDLHLKRARILHASDDAFGHEPAWTVSRAREYGERHGATIGLAGLTDVGVLSDLDPERLRRDSAPGGREWVRVTNESRVNWTVGACPTPEWAALAYPQLEPEQGLAQLWDDVVHTCRLDTDDPIGAWSERVRELSAACARLRDARFDSLHVEGPGTDLTIGLFASSDWLGAEERTAYGLPFHPNLPTEEVFTTPDPARVEGVVRATRPIALLGTVVRDLVVRFEAGRVVSLEASEGAGLLRAHIGRDDGGSRVGEFALVDDRSRVAALDTVFCETLFDENAASHMALGSGYSFGVADPAERDRVNMSEVHVDFMFGSPEVVVTGIRADGSRVPVLVRGAWGM